MTSEQAHIPAAVPCERYTFQFSPGEASAITSRSLRVWIRRPLWFLFALLVLMLLYASSVFGGFAADFLFGMLLMAALLYYKSYQATKRAMRGGEGRFCETEYRYEICGRELVLHALRNGEERLMQRIELERIDRIQDLDGYLTLILGNTVYPLRTADLAPESVLFGWMHANPKKVGRRPARKPERWGNVLFALSILTLPVAIVAAQLFDEYFASVEQSAPVLFALALIPAASVICGFVLRKKGYSGTKNIVVGLVIALLLCFCGGLFLASF